MDVSRFKRKPLDPAITNWLSDDYQAPPVAPKPINDIVEPALRLPSRPTPESGRRDFTTMPVRVPQITEAVQHVVSQPIAPVAEVAPSTPLAPPAVSLYDPVPELPPSNVTININLPEFKIPAIKKPDIDISKLKERLPALPELNYKKVGIGLSAVALVIVVGGVGLHLLKPAPKTTSVASKVGSSGVVSAKPVFTPVAPSSNAELAQGVPDKTAYDTNRSVYSYTDSINGTKFTVSQQKAPTAAANPLKTAAQQIGAKEQLTTSNGVAYMKTDPKSGDQTIVASVKGLLVFVQSPFKHSTDDWQRYISSLQ